MGLTINVLYCVCKGKQEISLFEIVDDCAKTASSKPSSCCKKTICHNTDEVQITDKHNCTSKSQKFVKLNSEVVVGAKTFQVNLLSDIDFSQTWVDNFQPSSVQIQEGNPNKAPPDKPHGKTLLPFIQSYLC